MKRDQNKLPDLFRLKTLQIFLKTSLETTRSMFDKIGSSQRGGQNMENKTTNFPYSYLQEFRHEMFFKETERQDLRTPNNLVRALKPVRCISSLLGLFDDPKQHQILKLFYNLIVFSILVATFINQYPNLIFWIHNSSGLHGAITKLEAVTRWVFFFLNYLASVFYRYKTRYVVESLSKLSLDLPEKVERTALLTHVIHLVLNMIFLVIYDVMGYAFVWQTATKAEFIPAVYIFTDLVILWSTYEYFHFLNIIRLCFKTINKKMKHFLLKGRKDAVRYVRTQELRDFRILQLQLYNIIGDLNTSFSVQLLAVIFMALIEATYALRSLVQDVDNIQKYPLDFAMNILWITFYFVNVYQPIVIADITKLESKKQLKTIHRMINDYNHDYHIERELELFSLQISQHEVDFSVFGFFSLDLSLVGSIIGTMTTYFVMTITFNGEWESGNNLEEWEFDYPDT